jgi:hypothetical protein
MHKVQIMHELGFIQYDGLGTILFIDNQSVEYLAEIWKIGERSIHINTKYHLVRPEYIQGRIFFIHVDGEDNIVDYLSKPSEVKLFRYNRDSMMYGNDENSISENILREEIKKERIEKSRK